jgi:hypothetical protein
MPANRLAATAALTLALTIPAVAPAATGGKYKGKTEQNRPVTFKVSKGKVKSFEAGINVFCIGDGIKFNAVIPPKAMKLKKGGKFSYKGRDRINSANIEIKGRVKGSKASGKISMTYSQYDASTRLFMGCSGEATFKAKRR